MDPPRRHPGHHARPHDPRLRRRPTFHQTRRALRTAEVEKRISHPQLVLLLNAHRTSRGAQTIRRLLTAGPAPTRSALEDHVLDHVKGNPLVNVKLGGREFDLVLPEHRLILEVDGPDTHGTPTTDAIDAEKTEIANLLGFDLIRLRS